MEVDAGSSGSPASAGADQPNAEGQAAFLLIESLIHGLIARSVISLAEAVEIIDSAAEVQAELDENPPTSSSKRISAYALLGAIRSSLSRDLPNG